MGAGGIGIRTPPQSAKGSSDTVTIHVTPHPLKTFLPAHAFGAGIDGAEAGTAARVFRPESVAAMRSMGLRALTYRLRTELAIEAWHWNPQGHWSGGQSPDCGYWTGDEHAVTGPIDVGWGYRLPRRGSTIDQANDDSYSRIDDGDPQTFWKSNPYLDRHFTGESNALHPQWVVVDLGKSFPVDSIRLRWGVPFATRYRVEYGVLPPDVTVTGSDSAFEPDIAWKAFPRGVVASGKGGDDARRLSDRPITARFVRVWMTESSGVAPAGSRDIRDGLGYSLRELSIGQHAKDGKVVDFVARGRTKTTQSVVYVSSTDPWHRAEDRDRGVEQPGFDRVATSGLANDQPILMPVSLLYDTPDNAAAELQYLRARHIPIRQIEMGEEPDGQYVTPEDYGALYVQWAEALHRVDPTVQLGGPSFQTAVEGWVHWTDARGDMSWLRRFLRYLTARGHRADFAFFSFEWYPFDDLTRPASAQAPRNGNLLRETIARLRDEGLPKDIPWMISEYGYSSFATHDEVMLPGALVNAETVAEFLTLGGDQAFLYGYEPGGLNLDHALPGATWGNLIALLDDSKTREVDTKLPAYWAARLLTNDWTGDPHRPHDLFRATVAHAGRVAADPLLAAYPLRRPDGRWAVLLLNKDAHQSRAVRIAFDESGKITPLRGPLDIWRYGSDQYAWQDGGADGHPLRSLPPAHETRALNASANSASEITLPPFSLCVVCGSR